MFPVNCTNPTCDGVCYGALLSPTERAAAYAAQNVWSAWGAHGLRTDDEHAAAAATECARFRAAECFQHMLSVVTEPVFDAWMDGLVRAYRMQLTKCGGEHRAAVARLREMDATKTMVRMIRVAVTHGLVNNGETAVRSAEDKRALAGAWFEEWHGWQCFNEGSAAPAFC